MPITVHVSEDKNELTVAVSQFVVEQSKLAIKERGRFMVALSGGSLPQMLASVDVNAEEAGKWHVFFSDERVLCDPADKNELAARQHLLSRLAVPDDQIYGVTGDDDPAGDQPNTASAAVVVDQLAKSYEQRMLDVFGGREQRARPQFDLVLLGVGPDGHTASLFPGHRLLAETSRLIAPIVDSPKPPPNRITFTYPLINAARAIAFVAAGSSKQDVLPALVRGQTNVDEPCKLELLLPSARILPADPSAPFLLFTDKDAAIKLD